MPLWPGSGLIGLGLWNSVPATLIVEFVLFALGVWTYGRLTDARDVVGRWAWRAFVLVLALLFLASAFGPPPPSIRAVAWTGIAGWLFVAWGYWIERHRTTKESTWRTTI
jgi:hypothetical protein